MSWSEFIHQILSQGEVQQLIVMPNHDAVKIILHEGAIIKGKRVNFVLYNNFEF